MNFRRTLIPATLAFAALTMTACNDDAGTIDTHGTPGVDIGTPAVVDTELDTFRTAFEIALATDQAAYCEAFWQLDDDAVIAAVEDGYGETFTANEAAIVLDIFYTNC